MEKEFFNYAAYIAATGWERRTFFSRWQSIYQNDRRWAPPPYRRLTQMLTPDRSPHLARRTPQLIHMEAVERRTTNNSTLAAGLGASGILREQAVCAAILLTDPRSRERTGALAYLHTVNDPAVVERFLWTLQEQSYRLGIRRLVAPVGLSSFLPSGALMDNFHRPPPLHTIYNPPYVPEILSLAMSPVSESRLYTAHVSSSGPGAGDACISVPPAQMTATLGPLSAAIADQEGNDDEAIFPSPDAAEIAFYYDWLRVWPMEIWVYQTGGENAGFIILQPDLAPAMAQAQGGRRPWQRAWLAWRMRRPVDAGRIVLGGVQPAYRRQGIGARLWMHALNRAAAHGWRTLTVGPVTDESSGASFLREVGATPQQRYVLFGADL
ncbi:MAG: GNAT family N-acetyltransferase [Caldilineaceae bacterium]|nr:GNAT family N-acetyltransferase [Caldilineaceae bacterium]